MPKGTTTGNGLPPINVVTNIDARGAYPESLNQIKAAIAKRDAELPQKILSTVRDGKNRNLV